MSAGVAHVCIGTATYAIGAGWGVIDALYFAVATLTTTVRRPWPSLPGDRG